MDPAISILNQVNYYFYMIVGSIELLIGTIGNLLVVILFSQQPLRSAPTSATVMTVAVLGTIYLDFITILRFIAGLVNQPNITFGNDILCRLYHFLLTTSAHAFMLNLSYIAVDRYLCSCRSVRIRAWSNRKVLRIANISILTGTAVMNSPYLFFARNIQSPLTGSTTCSVLSTSLLDFRSYFQTPVILILVPLLVLSIFGFLTIRNIRSVRQTSNALEQQMTRVLLLQTFVVAICISPFAIVEIYARIISNINLSPLRFRIQTLIYIVAVHIYYIQFCSNFFVFIFGSKLIRHKFFHSIMFRRVFSSQVHPTQPLHHRRNVH